MSNGPPPGGPPPYGYPPPAPGAFAYVPAPVMMAMYPHPSQEQQPQPTYVTNYIYHPPINVPPEPVTIVQDPGPIIDWVPSTSNSASSLTNRAVVAGKEGWDSSPLWIIRAHHNGDFIPGKLAIKHRSAYVPYSGKEVPVHNFEVLCAPPHAVHWLPDKKGQVPPGAIVAGNTHSAEPLYIGRVRHMRSITPGKIHPSHGCCYISFGGGEVTYKHYEVLCSTVG